MPAKKIALVTGANKGIGFEIAQQLAEHGVQVLLGARNERRGREAAESISRGGSTVHPLLLDVTDVRTISDAVSLIDRRHGHLDILVNNAGISGSFTGEPSQATADDLREVYETNVFGVVEVTNAMLPLLRRAPAARIVNVSGHGASLSLITDPASPFAHVNMIAYQSSKTALNAITVAYSKELKDTPIKVNVALPGYVATDINNHRGTRTPAQGAVIAVRLALLDAHGPNGATLAEDGTVPW